jgi:dihydroceramidase
MTRSAHLRRRTAAWVARPLVALLIFTPQPSMAAAAPATTGATVLPGSALTTYYDFRSPNPPGGFCEQQVFGPGRVIAEPINAIFSLTTLLLGLFGLFRSKRTSMAFQFLFGLLAAYGLFAAVYHATLMNGLYRMKDVAISMVQSFVIIMLVHSLYLYRVKQQGRESSRGSGILVSLTTLVFTAYPAAVHVFGESSPNPWVAWLVFDLLWILIATQLILIWRRRFTWPKTPPNARVFGLVWYAIACTVLAYAGWCADKLLCRASTPGLAYLALHGWWHVFMGAGFYYLITLCRYFSAHEYGFEPILERIPARGPLGLSFVEWQSRRRTTATPA